VTPLPLEACWEELDLPVRLHSALKRVFDARGLDHYPPTVADVLTVDPAELLGQYNVGKKSVATLSLILRGAGHVWLARRCPTCGQPRP